jgi:ArsR family transcriptional regulator
MDHQQIEKISKALADQTRLAIYEAIARRCNMTCADMVEMRGVTPATISHHLKILQEAGLVESHKEGQFLHSRVLPEAISAYCAALARLASTKRSSRKG